MATTIKLKNGSGAPLAGDLVAGEPALDLTNKRLYTEDTGGTVIEVGTNPTSLTTGTFTSTGIDDNATSTAITIDSSQNVTVGGTTAGNAGSVNLSVGSPGSTAGGLQLWAGASGSHFMQFGDVASGDGYYRGAIGYLHASDSLVAYSAGAERMRIDSSGNVGIGANTAMGVTTRLTMANAGPAYLHWQNTTSTGTGWTVGIGSSSELQFFSSTGALGSGTFTERMRIDSSGNVGIGTSSPPSATNYKYLAVHATTNSYLHLTNSTTGSTSADGFDVVVSGLDAALINREAGNLRFSTSDTERMRIDSSGNVIVGTTSASAKLTIVQPSGADREVILAGINGVSNGFQVRYISGAMQYVLTGLGTGTVSSSAGVLSASSDQNMKIADGCVDNALDKISALTPRYFYWKDEDGNSDIDKGRQLGFFAQEVNKVVPEAAPEPKDGQDGWGVFDRSIVATAVKAIQEQQAMIEELKAEIAALKGA